MNHSDVSMIKVKIPGDVLNAPRFSPPTNDELAEDLAKKKK